MHIKEKIFLIQMLLEDIRGNWGYSFGIATAEERAEKAKELCEEVAKELNDECYLTLADTCSQYIKACDDYDGRYFRDDFPYGYINMDSLHGLTHTYHDKSEEFKGVATSFLTHPECRFNDWED